MLVSLVAHGFFSTGNKENHSVPLFGKRLGHETIIHMYKRLSLDHRISCLPGCTSLSLNLHTISYIHEANFDKICQQTPVTGW